MSAQAEKPVAVTGERAPLVPTPRPDAVEPPVEPSTRSPSRPESPAVADHPAPRRLRGAWEVAIVAARLASSLRSVRVALALVPAVALFLAGTGYDYEPARAAAALPELEAEARRTSDRETLRTAGAARRLESRIRAQVPRGSYVVIDQTHNRIRLMKGEKVVLEAPCSAGSGLVLRESAGNRVWVFDTPRGAFSVLTKVERPVWKKPDWAFVEEGEPIPSDPSQRFEYGVLGEYALYFGNGYMIHGTLYERLIGRPVSHGCIRVGRDPLREIYRAVPLGGRVFIY